ncbi:TPA: hypothetical protein P0E24_000305 [Vibrio campbellii]|nr:hypothetical protein [Vibrio campbellii]HDM8241277.1 hypothetical protein [Vibrio campbellii]
MKKLTEIQKELKDTTERMFKDSSTRYKAYIAFLMIGQFHGLSPVEVANDFGTKETLKILDRADGIQSTNNELERKNPNYARVISGTKANLARNITTPTHIKWVALCWVLLQLERLRPERR